MKIEGFLFAGGAAFYGLLAVVYWFITEEVVGTTALALTGGLAFLIGFYVLLAITIGAFYVGVRVGLELLVG